jgi:transcriptional regulator
MPILHRTPCASEIQSAGRLLWAILFPDDELWVEIAGFPGYRVSSLGGVQTRKKNHGAHGYRPDGEWRDKAPGISRRGYRLIRLYKGGKGFTRFVHRLVLEAFVGPRPEGLVGLHGDGDPSNNRLSNIRWSTSIENAADRQRHGRTPRGERHSGSKLTDDEVREIRRRLAAGEKQSDIARQFGIALSNVGVIRCGRAWSHIAAEIPLPPVVNRGRFRPKTTRRGDYVRGEGHPDAKLTEANVIEVRRLYREGVKQVELARRFGVGQDCVSRIVLGKAWKHLKIDPE